MAGGSAKSNPPRPRKRVEAETATVMRRAKDGSAFTKCEACHKDVPVGLIDMHDCGMDSKIKKNLQAQVVEKVTEVMKTERKRAAPSSQKVTKAKKEKKPKDSTKRKRPPSAFFLFMDDFRKEFKEANPDNKNVALVAKEGGARWKSMNEEERKPYHDKANELKDMYENADKESGHEEGNEEEKVEKQCELEKEEEKSAEEEE
ncbi:hypothetical protein HPP92_014761 [Vanilla planifolia]|uniref:HMG box domain-containing protein n=1 Tax=Vanilla planifolia TaxID=51239 RepID=A0A835QNA0_VANPL|nr:hypothetical protein HPP92_014761 [Vanilla planifolia]